MSEKEILEEKIKEKKEFNAKDYIDKMLNKSYLELEGMAQARADKIIVDATEAAHKHEHKLEAAEHSHATHVYDKFCPSCGDKNPDFDPDVAFCSDCGEAVGSVKQVNAGEIKACPGCGNEKGAVSAKRSE